MSDYWLREAERRSDESASYADWVDNNEDTLIYEYGETITEFPESIYEGVLDDDYEKIEVHYLENLTIKDVPEDFIQSMYESYNEEE